MRAIKFYIILLSCLICSCSVKHDDGQKSRSFDKAKDVTSSSAECVQRLYVISESKLSYKGIMYGVENAGGSSFYVSFDTVSCTVGKNGIADYQKKMEGDGKTPSGNFDLGHAFGYDSFDPIGIEYLELEDYHYWIYDTTSNGYNTLVEYKSEGILAEKMERSDHLYKYGVVINYNTNPIIKGKGSAIFIHIFRRENSPTLGCIGISEQNMIKLLKWFRGDCRREITIVANDKK